MKIASYRKNSTRNLGRTLGTKVVRASKKGLVIFRELLVLV